MTEVREQVAELKRFLQQEWFPLSDSQATTRAFALSKLDDIEELLGDPCPVCRGDGRQRVVRVVGRRKSMTAIDSPCNYCRGTGRV